MGLFEKIELEPIEAEDIETAAELLPEPQGGNDTLTIVYPLWKRVLLLLGMLLMLPVLDEILAEGIFAFEVVTLAIAACLCWYLGDCLLTSEVTFAAQSIVKTGLLGRTVLPTTALLLTSSEQSIRFVHGSAKNCREAVRIHRFIITTQESADILAFAAGHYQGVARGKGKAAAPKGKWGTNKLALSEYDKAAKAYQALSAFFVVFAVIAIFAVGLSDNFTGYGHELPSFPLRLVCICLAIGGFIVLRRLAPSAARLSSGRLEPLALQLKQLDGDAFYSALTAVCVALLGLVLLFLFGNLLDFYLFLLVGVLYYLDCYPRLSTWENTLSGAKTEVAGSEAPSVLPRRSLQVSLVLMGALAVLSYGESSHYLYKNRKDCLDDWGDSRDCREAAASGGHGGGYYGPRYGSGGGRALRSVGVGSVSRGGFGSLGSFHASFGG